MKRFYKYQVTTNLIIDFYQTLDVSPNNDFVYIRPPTFINSSFNFLSFFNPFDIIFRLSSESTKYKIKFCKTNLTYPQPHLVYFVFKIKDSQLKMDVSLYKVVYSQLKMDAKSYIIVNKNTK